MLKDELKDPVVWCSYMTFGPASGNCMRIGARTLERVLVYARFMHIISYNHIADLMI